MRCSPVSNKLTSLDLQRYSGIRTADGWYALQRPYPIHGLWAFFRTLGIEPVVAVKLAGGFVNTCSAVITARIPKDVGR